MVDYWAGYLVAGRSVERDRESEFTASGSVPELVTRIEDAKRQLRHDHS